MRIVIPLVLLLAGCQYVPMLPGLSPHKIDIQQGNYVTQDMVDKLKPGMSRSQVRFALGTPLVVDPFHADRWDYVYVSHKRGRLVDKRLIVVVFQDDKLVRLEGEGAASATPGATRGAAAPAQAGAATPADAPPVPAQ
jgi:outer membrane protein assembly factor BamE